MQKTLASFPVRPLPLRDLQGAPQETSGPAIPPLPPPVSTCPAHSFLPVARPAHDHR